MRFALLLAVLTACTSSSESAQTACTKVATARCDRLAACSMADLQKRWADEPSCVDRETQLCEESLVAPATAATPATVDACAVALAASTCDSLFDVAPPTACLAQHGSGATGAACSFPAQCASGYCSVDDTQLCGTCQPEPVAGASCASAGCGQSMSCVASTMQCQVPVVAGGACSSDLPCAETLDCVGATQTAMGTCMASLTTAGSTCDPRRMTGPSCSTTAGLACNTSTKQCVTQPLVAAGQQCGQIANVNTRCLAGATCQIATGATTGTCVAPAADGATCNPTNGPGCEQGARCVNGTCQLPGSQTCS